MRSRIWRSHAAGSTRIGKGATPFELVLVRHASSTRAQIGIWGRRFDAPLAAGFEKQLARTKSALQFLDRPTVFSSPLARCRDTAAFVFPEHDIQVVDQLKAYHSGVWEDVTEDYIRHHHPTYLGLSFRDRFLRPEFGEESMDEQAQRVACGLLRVLQQSAGTTVIVAHYSSINVVAHIASRNFETHTYADGTYDLPDGGYISLTMNPTVVVNDLEERFGLRRSEFDDWERVTK